jgi:CheY-like chemotaxis protein
LGHSLNAGEAAVVTVLVVDDDPAIGRLIGLILSAEAMAVERVTSGESALARLQRSEQPDVILLDLAMPGMDGRDVFREARRMGVTCPIVFCSAYGAELANAELGGQGAIEKPFLPDALVASLRAVTSDGVV